MRISLSLWLLCSFQLLHAVCDNFFLDHLFAMDRYVEEGNKVYYCSGGGWAHGRVVTTLEGVDADSFETLDGDYARDKDTVYHRGHVLPYDVDTFINLSNAYVKDKNGVYYGGKRFDCDADSFRLLDDTHAMDKNHLYVIVYRVDENNRQYSINKIASPEHSKRYFKDGSARLKAKRWDDFMDFCTREATPAQMHTLRTVAAEADKKMSESSRRRICEFVAVEFLEPETLLGDGRHENLYLFHKEIADITPLGWLQGITELDLAHNPVRDVAPLGRMTRLRKLDLGDTAVTSIEPLTPLVYLKELELHNTPNLRDASAAAKLPRLEELSLWGGVTSFAFLKQMKQLTSLSIRVDSAAQAQELGFPEQLETLRLSGNGISTLNTVSSLKQLRYLSLHAPVKDLAPLTRMPQLTDLRLYDVPVDDLSLLAVLPNLEDLDVDKMRLQRCSPETISELREGKSCYEKDGTLKPLWKRWLGF